MKYILIALLFCTCGSSGEVEPTYFDSHFLGATYYSDKPDWQLADGILDSGYHIERGLLYNFEVKDTLPAKLLIDSTGIRMAKDLGFPKYNGQTLLLFGREGDAHIYYDSVGWIVKDDYGPSSLPERFSPKTIDSIVKHSESPWIDTLPAKPLNIKMKPRWRDSLTSIKDGAIRDMTDFELGSTLTIDSGWLSKGGYDTIRNFGEEISRFIISLNTDTVKVIMLVSDTSSQNGYRTQRCYWMYGHEVRNDWGILMIDRDGRAIDNTVYLDDKKVPLSKNVVVWLSKELK